MSSVQSSGTKVRLVGLAVLVLASAATIYAGFHRPEPALESPPDTPEKAFAELKAGNERFQKSRRTKSANTRSDGERRKELAKGQHPIAAVLCCADSRVVPEFVFDQGFGGIFDVSNAGNVVDNDVLGSLEYAVHHLHVPVVVVLGHKGCGAVEAVAGAGDERLPGHLRDIQMSMPGVSAAGRKAGKDRPEDFLVRLCGDNARAQARRLLTESPVLRDAVKKKETSLAVGLYDMESGAVEWYDFDASADK